MANLMFSAILIGVSLLLLVISGELGWLVVLLPLALLAGYGVARRNGRHNTLTAATAKKR